MFIPILCVKCVIKLIQNYTDFIIKNIVNNNCLISKISTLKNTIIIKKHLVKPKHKLDAT